MIKVSIIIPIYNVENYIEECLSSVVNQTYKNLEIICVDDCGEDRSMDIVNSYAAKDDRFIILKNTVNSGLPLSRNYGFKEATGDYIFFLDSDDYLYLNCINNLLDHADRTKSDIIISSTKVFIDDKEDKKTYKRSKSIEKFMSFNPLDNYQVDIDNFKKSISFIPSIAWGKLIKKSFLDNNSLEFIKKRSYFEDEGFHLKVLSCYPNITSVSDIGVYYRIRPESITGTTSKNIKLKFLNEVLEDSLDYIRTKADNEKNTENVREEYAKVLIDKTFFKILTIRLLKKNKIIKLFGITLFKDIINNQNIRTIKCLSITLLKKKVI